MISIVSLTLFLPLLGALVLVALPGISTRGAHAVGIVFAGLAFVGSVVMWARGVGEGLSLIHI